MSKLAILDVSKGKLNPATWLGKLSHVCPWLSTSLSSWRWLILKKGQQKGRRGSAQDA